MSYELRVCSGGLAAAFLFSYGMEESRSLRSVVRLGANQAPEAAKVGTLSGIGVFGGMNGLAANWMFTVLVPIQGFAAPSCMGMSECGDEVRGAHASKIAKRGAASLTTFLMTRCDCG
jgi:hypothetical protein